MGVRMKVHCAEGEQAGRIAFQAQRVDMAQHAMQYV